MLAELRLIRVAEYHQMVAAGILRADERIELIDGQLFQMAAKGPAHAAATTRTERTLRRLLGDQVVIRRQDPIRLNDYSEPEPDVAIVKLDPLDYATHHPTRDNIYWLIEIADTTLKQDTQIKAAAYARAGIGEYWVLDLPARRLLVLRSPQQGAYQTTIIGREGEQISPLQFPAVAIAVTDLLPPVLT